MIEVAINGCNGKMGQVIADTIAASFADQARVSYGVDLVASQNGAFPVYASFTRIPTEAHADVMIDFSNPAALPGLLDYTVSRNIPVVIATTGLSREDEQAMRAASEKIPVFWSANMSIGICLLKELVKKAAAFLGESYDIEIVERHHNRKLDAPSGTALAHWPTQSMHRQGTSIVMNMIAIPDAQNAKKQRLGYLLCVAETSLEIMK